MDRPRQVGLAWYERHDYPRILAVMDDASQLPTSYEGWRLSAEQVESEVARSGIRVVRVPLDPDQFVAWCLALGLRRDGRARSRFASEAAGGSPGGGPEAAGDSG